MAATPKPIRKMVKHKMVEKQIKKMKHSKSDLSAAHKHMKEHGG